MRILLTTDTIGGVWTFTQELTAELLQRKNDVALVSLGASPTEEQVEWCSALRLQYGNAFRYDSFLIPLEWMPANTGAYTAAEPLLLGIASEFLPEILHLNQYCFGKLPIGIPKLITAHSDVVSWSAACNSEDLSPGSWLETYRVLVQQGLDAADAVVAPSHWMLNALGKYFQFPGSQHVVLNGRSLPEATNPGRRGLQAVSAGRLWDKAKNIAILAEVKVPFPIFVAGEGHPEDSAALDWPSNIELLGKLNERDLLTLFRSSSIYIASSRYEPFGLAPLEAALCGCAVIANDIPSFREVWGQAACYFRDTASLNQILMQLSHSPALLEAMRKRSERRARQLTRAGMADGYVAIYDQLVSRFHRNSAYECTAYA